MRYFKVTADTPYCGTEVEEYLEVDETEVENVEEYIEGFAQEVCANNAEGFEYLIAGWDYEPTDDELEDYRAGCEYWYEEISKEEFEERP